MQLSGIRNQKSRIRYQVSCERSRTPIRPFSPSLPPSTRAFTLLELLVTISIASIILGLSVGSYMLMAKTLSYGAATQMVQGQLLAARNAAISRQASSFMTIDGANNTIQVFGQEFAGVWHFDDEDVGEQISNSITEGALSQKGNLKDGSDGQATPTLASGRYGAGLSFSGGNASPSEQLYVECGASPAYIPVYNTAEGVSLSAWVYPESSSNGTEHSSGEFLPVVSKIGDSSTSLSPYTLFLEYDNTKQKFKAGALITESDDTVTEVMTDDAIVRPQTWTHIAMIYSRGGSGIRLYMNGILRKENTTPDGLLEINTRPLRIGQTESVTRGSGSVGTAWFSGIIDEVSINVFETSPEQTIPEKIGIVIINPATGDEVLGPYKIYFDSRGYLDRQFHTSLPELIVLSPTHEWIPPVHTLYADEDTLNTFRNTGLGSEEQRNLLDASDRISLLKLSWAGTVE